MEGFERRHQEVESPETGCEGRRKEREEPNSRLLAWTIGWVVISLAVIWEMVHVWEEDDVPCSGHAEFKALVGHANGGIQKEVRRDLGWK